jgi:hypothetical protein
MLLGHYGFNPTLTLPGDHIHGAVQCLALEPLGLEDLGNLLAFAFGCELDMTLLHPVHMFVFLDLGLGATEIRCRHGEAVCKQVGGAEDQQALVERSAPTTPATTAKVVTVPSMPP